MAKVLGTRITSAVLKMLPRTAALVVGMLLLSCREEVATSQATWIDNAVEDWPTFALTNEIVFEDTTFSDLANSFLISTGFDTLAVSCKHIFIVFENTMGINSIDLGKDFVDWYAYHRNLPGKRLKLGKLINQDTNELVQPFRLGKVSDWIIFSVPEDLNGLHPLRVRLSPVRKGETVYVVGWGALKQFTDQSVIEMQCFKQMGDYFYVKTLTEGIDPNGRSGSAVIDENGHLVGIVSGQEGSLGVIGSTKYLQHLFEKYQIPYQKD